MALGAFLAGVLLASSEYQHALETDIEPFKGLLLGLFFISVGMSVDFGLLERAPGAIAAIVAGLLALKLVTLWIVARVMGVGARQRWLFAALLAQGGEFAFVVFGVAQTAGVLSADACRSSSPSRWRSRWRRRRSCSSCTTRSPRGGPAPSERPDDEIEESGNPVIIAGFGRFGQIVARLLFANGMRAIVLDHDPEQVELLRKFGYKVFYGDATRLDLLRAAGAADACLLVNAIDDIADSLALTDRVREHFPDLPMIARARNVTHYVELRMRGVTWWSARPSSRRCAPAGTCWKRWASTASARAKWPMRSGGTTSRRWMRCIPHFRDEAKVLSEAKAGREELREFFARDRAQFETEQRKGWKAGILKTRGKRWEATGGIRWVRGDQDFLSNRYSRRHVHPVRRRRRDPRAPRRRTSCRCRCPIRRRSIRKRRSSRRSRAATCSGSCRWPRSGNTASTATPIPRWA